MGNCKAIIFIWISAITKKHFLVLTEVLKPGFWKKSEHKNDLLKWP